MLKQRPEPRIRVIAVLSQCHRAVTEQAEDRARITERQRPTGGIENKRAVRAGHMARLQQQLAMLARHLIRQPQPPSQPSQGGNDGAVDHRQRQRRNHHRQPDRVTDTCTGRLNSALKRSSHRWRISPSHDRVRSSSGSSSICSAPISRRTLTSMRPSRGK